MAPRRTCGPAAACGVLGWLRFCFLAGNVPHSLAGNPRRRAAAAPALEAGGSTCRFPPRPPERCRLRAELRDPGARATPSPSAGNPGQPPLGGSAGRFPQARLTWNVLDSTRRPCAADFCLHYLVSHRALG